MHASRPPLAQEAAALVHLLDLADKVFLGRGGSRLEDGPELIERQPRPVVLLPTIDLHDAPLSQQVALLANRVLEWRL